ncbi:unnamed protein product [Diatraea saccharalis]|uniref:Factor VIII intron 22 protein n=1 Tax=Diatraea saccharalis TaxID=40085 RepID=A0A9N9WFB1_9NEOP|nr:unnamed protein product [Diatraea saccharalis]
MSTDLNANFNEQYMQINSKLKKRFMRKPNITEATNEFIALAIQCEHSEQPAFAAQAYVGAAKCEAAAGNYLGEAEYYVTAGRHYMKAEIKLASLKFYSPDRENLEAGIGCFMLALGKYPPKSPLRTSILIELANDLIALNYKLEAASYYEQALETVTDQTVKNMCLKNLLNLQIDCDNMDVALETANLMCESNVNIPEDILIEVQVSRILLTLLVDPLEQNKPDSLRHLFADLLSDNGCESAPFSTDLKLKLQSIIISSSRGDVSSLLRISTDIKHLLTNQQIDLLDKLNKEMRQVHLTMS